jgi:hypothetical protein
MVLKLHRHYICSCADSIKCNRSKIPKRYPATKLGTTIGLPFIVYWTVVQTVHQIDNIPENYIAKIEML